MAKRGIAMLEFHDKWHGREVEVVSGPFKGQCGVAQFGDSSLDTVAVAFPSLKHDTWFEADALRIKEAQHGLR